MKNMNVYVHNADGYEIIHSTAYTMSDVRIVCRELGKIAKEASRGGKKTSVGVHHACGVFYLDGEKLMSVMAG